MSSIPCVEFTMVEVIFHLVPAKDNPLGLALKEMREQVADAHGSDSSYLVSSVYLCLLAVLLVPCALLSE